MSDVSVVVGDLPGPQPDVNLPVLPEADPVYPQEEGEPLRMTVTRGVPKEEVEQVAPVALPQDEYQDEDWVRSYHGRRMDSRRVLTGPDAQDFESQGIDPRNLLDDNAFDNAVKFYDRVMEPYAEVGRTILDVNQETGRALASGMYSAAQGFIDTTGEIAELLADVTGVDPYVIWDDQGLRLTDERPDDYEPYTLPKFFTDPQTMVGQIGADLTQFVAAMGAFSLGTLGAIPSGTARFMALGAVADSLFDPEEGNFSTMLMELGVEPNVVLEYLGTPVGEDAGAAERLGQRLKQAFEGAAIGLPFDLAVPAFKAFQALKGNPDILQRALTHLEAAGERAALRIEERAAGRSTTLGMGIDPGEVIDPLLAAAGRALGLRNKPLQAEGGVRLPEAKTSENLRLHQQRITKMEEKGAAYPGAPKNPRTVIKAPEGSGLPDLVIGAVTPEDWRVRIEAAMTPDEIQAASKWYDTVYDEFDRVTGGNKEESKKLAKAWLAAQQKETPANALASVVYMYEQIQRGVPIDQIKGEGLPQANKAALAALRNADIESGVGQKIADFFDSADGKNVRSIMGNDPAGGSPFVVDVHTGRDTGLVDQELVNHLTRLGYDVPDDVITDLDGGGIKGAQYESRVLFGHQLTDHLNDMNWMGRSDWEPREIQAIGWSQLTKMYGGEATGGDVAGAIQRSTRRLSMEVDPGEGSPWALKYGDDYSALDEADQYAINEKVTARAVEVVNQREGINLGGIVHGTGGWRMDVNPSAVQQGVISRETAISAASRLALYLNQTEVWVNSAKGMTKEPSNYGIDILEEGTENLRNNDRLLELWEKIVEADPAVEFKGENVAGLMRGYQPIEDAAGKVGIRIIVDKEAMKEWAKAHNTNLAGAREAVNEFYTTKLDDIVESLDYDVSRQLHESELHKARNNWTEQPDGQSHQDNIRDAGRSTDPAQGGTDLDLDRAELEKLFGDLIGERRGRRAESLGEAGVPPQQQAAQPLRGLEPAAYGPNPEIEGLAASYAERTGIPYARQTEYAQVDPDFAARVADAYENMKHDPTNPAVQAAYKAMADETLAQYQVVKDAGYTIEMIRADMDPPYTSPREALEDLANNKHLWIYPTDFGYGPDAVKALDPETNPLLAFTDEVDVSGTPMRINDVFRAVHDFFGHGIEGTGFRARGEENAWIAHSQLYSDAALPAVTSETRGQNSWVNFGPHGKANQTAKEATTVFAEQKIGLMPSWTWKRAEGRPPDIDAPAVAPEPAPPSAGFFNVTLNNRVIQTNRVSEIHKIGPGKYKGIADGEDFTIEGGHHLGGARNEWFLDWSPLGSNFPVSGPRDAIKIIEGA